MVVICYDIRTLGIQERRSKPWLVTVADEKLLVRVSWQWGCSRIVKHYNCLRLPPQEPGITWLFSGQRTRDALPPLFCVSLARKYSLGHWKGKACQQSAEASLNLASIHRIRCKAWMGSVTLHCYLTLFHAQNGVTVMWYSSAAPKAQAGRQYCNRPAERSRQVRHNR